MTNKNTTKTMATPTDETVTGSKIAENQEPRPAANHGDRLATLKGALQASRGAQLLIGVLAAQLLLAGALLWQSNDEADFVSSSQLVSLDAKEVDELIIDSVESEGKSVMLRRTTKGWEMAGDPAYPADTVKVEGIIDTLASLSPGLPVATTESAQEQLEVADTVFQRRLRVEQGDQQVADLYLGSSPGFRKAHLRKAGEQAIYAARINVFDLPLSSDDWLDKQLLAYDTVDSLRGPGIELSREGDAWRIVEPAAQADTHEVVIDQINSIIGALQGLSVTSIVDTNTNASESATVEPDQESETDLADAAPNEVENEALELTVGSGDEALVLSLKRQGDDVVAARSDIAGEFRVAPSVFDTLSGFNTDTVLVASTADPGATQPADADPEGSTSEQEIETPAMKLANPE